jgi:hypothetical protein
MSRETYRADLEAARRRALDVFHDLAMGALARELKPHLDALEPPPSPGPITFTNISQDPTTMALTVHPEFQPPSMSDVALHRLRYTVNDGPEVVNDVPTLEADGFTLEFDHDDHLVGTYSQVDRAGNESPAPIAFDVVIKDTFGPPVEGTFGFSVTGQTEGETEPPA